MSGIAIQPNLEQQMAILSQTLLRRPNLEKLIQRTGMDASNKSTEELIEDLSKRLKIQGTSRDNLYTFTYRDPDRAEAMRLVESLIAMFLESSKKAGQRGSEEAKSFIEAQIKVYEKKLEEAENRLKEFKVRNLGMTEGGQGYFAKIEELRVQLQEARLALRQAENSRDTLKRQLAGEQPALPESTARASETETRIATLRRNLDGLLQRFTEQHPDVVGTKRIIAQLEGESRKEVAAQENARSASVATPTTVNPIYQQLKVSLAKEEANVASLSARVTEYESRYSRLKEAARLAPEIEAELAQLNRDYEINKKNFETLVARREQAQISSDLDAAGVAEFRVIDPPRVSQRPVMPNRVTLMPMLFLAALGAGIAASFGVSRLWPTFVDVPSLREVTGLPVLGAVSMTEDKQTRKAARRESIGFFSALGSLVLAIGAATAVLLFLTLRAV